MAMPSIIWVNGERVSLDLANVNVRVYYEAQLNMLLWFAPAARRIFYGS